MLPSLSIPWCRCIPSEGAFCVAIGDWKIPAVVSFAQSLLRYTRGDCYIQTMVPFPRSPQPGSMPLRAKRASLKGQEGINLKKCNNVIWSFLFCSCHLRHDYTGDRETSFNKCPTFSGKFHMPARLAGRAWSDWSL